MESSNCQTKILNLTKIPSRNTNKLNTLSNGGNLREFLSARHVLKEMLKDVLQAQGERNIRELGNQE